MEAPYGSWRSPIDARSIAEGGVGLGWPQAAGAAAYWVELRPTEEGRYVVVRRDPDGSVADVTPGGRNARTLVHEYGGGMYTAFRNERGGESVIFSDFSDQRLYRQDLGPGTSGGTAVTDRQSRRWTTPRVITPATNTPQGTRYADGTVTPDGRLMLCVRERHAATGVVNDLVALPTDGSSDPVALTNGHDFFAAPRVSADGRRAAWLCWDHPRMPWDGTELWVAEIDANGRPGATARLAGGENESVVQPRWTASGDLMFASDRNDWWNLYLVDAAAVGVALHQPDGAATEATPLAPLDAEFAKPHWVFGLCSFDLLSSGAVVAAYTRDGGDRLVLLSGDAVRDLPTPYTVVASLAVAGERVLAVAAGPTESWQVILLDPVDGATEVVRRGREEAPDVRYVSRPEPIAFPTWYEPGTVTGPLAAELARVASDTDSPWGARNVIGTAGRGAAPADRRPTLVAHALYFPPTNPDFTAPPGEKPPLLVVSHGGPTSAFETDLSMYIQYWTSRGFAVVGVNYGGSTGHGRAYRERLRGNWGIVDTLDCIRAAEFLVARGDVDPARLAVRGGSAGGYTTLNALTRFDTFTAGASHFGLADLERFVSGGTHKFEERYLVGLVGPYPEAAETFRDRSPINHVDGLDCPVILFQGLEDEIVPPEQAEVIVAALAKKGLPYAYLPFEGEQHGFRKAENIVHSLEAELYFYGRVFGFTPADEIEPVAIENLDERGDGPPDAGRPRLWTSPRPTT